MTTLPESRRFEEHLAACGTTAGGAQWVKTAVDPFHDVDLDVIGMPDSTSGRSVVYAVTSNLTLDAPTGVSGAWDCHVAFTPVIAKAKLNCFEGVKKTFGTTAKAPTYYPGSAVYQSTTTAEELRDSHLLTACSVASGEPTFFNKHKTDCEYNGLGVNEFLDDDGSSIVRVTGAAFEVHNTTEDLYKSGSVTTYKIAREADECNFMFTNKQQGGVQDHFDTVHATVSNGPPTDAASAKRYNGHTWDAADGCLVPGVLDARQSDGQKSLPRMHLTKVESRQYGPDGSGGGTKYWAPAFASDDQGFTDTYALGIRPTRDQLAFATDPITATAYYGGSGGHIERASPPTIVPEMMVSGAYFSGLSNPTKLTLTLRVFVEVFPASSNSLVPLAHPSNPYDAKALQCYQEIMSHMRSGYRVADNDAGDFFRKALAVARTVGRTLMPVMPPNIAAAIKVADGVAAKAEKALTKAQKIEQAVRTTLAESNKITPRVRNRARTKGKAMP